MKTSPVSLLELSRNALTILIVGYAAGSSAQNTPAILSSTKNVYVLEKRLPPHHQLKADPSANSGRELAPRF